VTIWFAPVLLKHRHEAAFIFEATWTARTLMDGSQLSSLHVGGVLVGRAEAGKVLPEVSLRLLKTTKVWASAIEAIVFPTADIADLVAANLGKGRKFTTPTAVHTNECRPVPIVVLVEPSIG
jgi:hypothetical protein